MTRKVNNTLLDFSTPIVMGILNATPDSFYAKSRIGEGGLETQISQMLKDGVAIFDVGGYSTRPGAKQVSEQEEISRVLPVLEILKTLAPGIPISIDTFRSNVARGAVKAGASIVNDVSGGNLDSEMFKTVADLQVPYVLTHMRGTPQTMATLCRYKNVTVEVLQELQKKCQRLREIGVKDIIVDPGFGFAKTIKQNFEILNNLEQFKIFELPILVGISRKSMIWKTLGTKPENALNGSTILDTLALTKGANILRVHDVKEASEAIKLLNA